MPQTFALANCVKPQPSMLTKDSCTTTTTTTTTILHYGTGIGPKISADKIRKFQLA
jgi:hypothetical protein